MCGPRGIAAGSSRSEQHLQGQRDHPQNWRATSQKLAGGRYVFFIRLETAHSCGFFFFVPVADDFLV